MFVRFKNKIVEFKNASAGYEYRYKDGQNTKIYTIRVNKYIVDTEYEGARECWDIVAEISESLVDTIIDDLWKALQAKQEFFEIEGVDIDC